MPTFKSHDGTELFYEDLGTGHPVVLIHGWPLSSAMWEAQYPALLAAGFRCIAPDRRGFGKSQRPLSGYDYDTLAGDVRSLVEHLKLPSVSLVGFSMGGGEVARYFSRFGADGVAKAVLISSVVPYLLKTEDNPNGASQSVFDEMISKLRQDRPAFLPPFIKSFLGVGVLSSPVSPEFVAWTTSLALQAAPWATEECARSFSQTDFRPDLKHMTKPTLVIHGDADTTVPIQATGQAAAAGIAGSRFEIIRGGPHGVCATHSAAVNALLTDFLT